MNFELVGVDSQIYEYIESNSSFLLFAGAGSGKTRTLVNLLQQIKKIKKDEMLIRGQKVAVITYTNAACDEYSIDLSMTPYSLFQRFIALLGN